MIPFTWAFHALVLHAWWLASGTSRSRTSRKGLLACCQGASDSLPHPFPGREVEASVFGIAVWRCSRQCHSHLAWNPPLSRTRDWTSLPLRVTTLSLKLSRSEVLGPPVLLSNYVDRLISRGPGVLSRVCHPSWVVSLVLQNLIGAPWSSSGHTKSIFSGSESTLHPSLCLGWAYWCVPCYVISWLSFQGLGWGVFFFFRPGLRGEDSGPLLPCSSVCGLHCDGPTKHKTIAMGDCYVLCGRSGVTWSAWLRIVSDASGSFLPQGVVWRSYRSPLSPSGSGCRCHGCAGSRLWNGLFCVPWAQCARAVAPSLLWEELCCHPGGRARLWHSCSSLRGCYLGAVASRFLSTFHRSCVVAVQALVLPRLARLDISLLTTWRLALGPCFLVRSPSIRRHPMGCHGWRFVYVSTIWNVVYIISWKYWITFLQSLSFLLR